MNFAAEYEMNAHFTIFGRIDNLTNEHYSEVFGFPALGRAVYGGVAGLVLKEAKPVGLKACPLTVNR